MSKLNLLVLILTSFLCLQVQAQTLITKISKLEIDQKEVKKDYKVWLYSENKSVEAKRTADGFIFPDELKGEEYLGVTITLGKHKLDFSKIHISNFNSVWTVGIDKKPFSEEFVTPEESITVKQVYYIKFSDGNGLDRMRLVIIN